MPYDFDRIIDRTNTYSQKWDRAGEVFGSGDIIPLWVADMDFASPPPLLDALSRRIDHGVMGYTFAPSSYYQSLMDWLARRHSWGVEREWITLCPSVVFAVHLAVRLFSRPGDQIVVQPPVYPPLFKAIQRNGREVLYNPLKLGGDRYGMDLSSLAGQVGPRTRMLILCSPHNPVGRVWERGELLELGQFCLDRNITILSDEIHSDLLYRGHRHVPIASLSVPLAGQTITLNAPTKTFNMAGLGGAYAVIRNEKMREVLSAEMERLGIHPANLFSLISAEAAYSLCGDWLDELLMYLQDNLDFLTGFIEQRIPSVRMFRPEGTSLVWLDFRELGMQDRQLAKFLVEEAGIGLNPGTAFGPGGEGFQRLNLGCPRSTLRKALEQLEAALEKLQSRPER
ncbi:MAG TPA: PatB family C-S lyase [Spirochaetia bacterium]|nr:PatB family C-S lyase [Spirochaetia bacterium]